MSRKTEAIRKSLENLDNLQKALSTISDEMHSRQLEDVSFKMSMELKSLTFWIDSLYAQNGQSKSRSKVNASRENGKKGGRPPKEITRAKQRISELEEVVIPDLNSRLRLADELFEEADLTKKKHEAEEEMKLLQSEIDAWEAKKRL